MQCMQLCLFYLTLLHIVSFSNELIVMTFEHLIVIKVTNSAMETHLILES